MDRKTLEDWEAVPNTNPLCDDIDDAARKLGYVFDKTKTAETAAIPAIASGHQCFFFVGVGSWRSALSSTTGESPSSWMAAMS